MIWIELNKDSKITLTRQLYDKLASAIIQGKLKEGERLESSRRFASRLGISRNIVMEVYDQLLAEGYLETRIGAGTYIAKRATYTTYKEEQEADRLPIEIDNRQYKYNTHKDFIYFNFIVPDMNYFPKKVWGKLTKEAYETLPNTYFEYCDPQGIYELRYSISEFLYRNKGLICKPEQIVIIQGSIQAFDIVPRLVTSLTNDVIIEDPSYDGIIKYFERHHYQIIPIEVDKKGINVNKFPGDHQAKLIVVTPSHHFPLGTITPIQRRIKLLEYAKETNSTIIENSYGGDFNLGIPNKTFFSLNQNDVFYIGTFSKSLYPALRLGYLVMPDRFISKYQEIKDNMYLGTNTISQYVLSRFMDEGFMARHILKMKKVYDKKRRILMETLKEFFGESVAITSEPHDFYIVCDFHEVDFTQDLVDKMIKNGVGFELVESYAIHKGKYSNKILLGFGDLDETVIIEGVKRIYQTLNDA